MAHKLSIQELRRMINEAIEEAALTPPGGSGPGGPTVWVVQTETAYEPSEIVGIFTSKEKADEMIAYIDDDIAGRSDPNYPSNRGSWGDRTSVKEFQLDTISEESASSLHWQYKPHQQLPPAPKKTPKKTR